MTYPKVEQPETMKIKLFDHQLTAIYMMEDRENNREQTINNYNNYIRKININMSIYADIVGYGKTLSIIGLIIRDKMKWDMREKHKICIKSKRDIGNFGIINDEKEMMNKYNRVNANLIVVNNTLINQWYKELKYSELKINKIIRKCEILDLNINEYDVILCSSKMYNNLMINKSNIAWKRFIFDEPQHTNIPAMEDVIAGYYWLISATPIGLYNKNFSSYHFLMKIFNARLEYDLFNKMIIKNDDDYVKKSYRLPNISYLYHNCYQPIYDIVNNHIDDITSQLISAGDISAAVTRLGGNHTSNIVELVKRKKENKIEQLRLIIRQNESNNNEKYEEDIKKLEEDINDLEKRFDEKLNERCPICIDKINEPILLSCCQNIFCGECVLKCMESKNTCPLCRSIVNTEGMIHIMNKQKDRIENKDNIEDKFLTKQRMVLEIIRNNVNGKFIIFSEFSKSFSNVEELLSTTNITYSQLKGHSSTISNKIKKFKEGKIQVLFLHSRYNGAGINLQEATDIIFYYEHENEEITKQIIGRANRIGRKEDLVVHYLI